ncbi:isoprenylcysteine carboxylmethyltransferase family protein [Sporolactobacillus sp. THM7-4]|uniref:Isoprenylcysteine carboxylmethyltransferase family protein n=4 Tax=Bacillales TaxID=1385 RepID=A0A6N8CNS1_9BACI|nr:isoprenylcysteine carboxylmethyltransferase family protein [Terrilactibacillus tamarindi]RYL92280.1 isoprenylcysteine carboxylmethyltransferase family protein [Sporolactobacillus sp. THM7-4]
MLMPDGKYAYGLWGAVLFNIVFFGLFAYSVFKPTTKRDWRTLGAFTGFMVALFSEMFGYPLTIYILTSILGKNYPVLDPFNHINGHLWVAVAGGSPILFDILHPLSNVFIFGGLIIIGIGWRKIHSGEGKLVTDGIYRFIRHPQYTGFGVAIIGFLIQWPTLITLIMAPTLLIMYRKLAKREEQNMIQEFGEEYLEYMKKVPRFVPKIHLTNFTKKETN